MMLRPVSLALLAAIILPLQAHGRSVGGVALADTLQFKSEQLSLSGAGLRSQFMIRLYVGSLYAVKTPATPEAILNGETISAIRLNIVSDVITSERMTETIEEGFKKSAGQALPEIRPQINDFIAVFRQKIVNGDQFTLISLPGNGVEAYKNGQLITAIRGEPFRQALFGIWLGSQPADVRLKNAMLGR